LKEALFAKAELILKNSLHSSNFNFKEH